jgi:hypothetical protein
LVDLGMFRAVVVCFEMKGSDVELEASNGHEAARRLLVQSGADVLLWGRVLREGNPPPDLLNTLALGCSRENDGPLRGARISTAGGGRR